MDTLHEAAMSVHKHNGDVIKFTESRTDLYYHDTTTGPVTAPEYTFVNSVSENRSVYTL
jgi:hypothetical protein